MLAFREWSEEAQVASLSIELDVMGALITALCLRRMKAADLLLQIKHKQNTTQKNVYGT